MNDRKLRETVDKRKVEDLPRSCGVGPLLSASQVYVVMEEKCLMAERKAISFQKKGRFVHKIRK